MAGPATTATTIANSTTAPSAASRWRRKRRNPSSQSEAAGVARVPGREATSRSVGVAVVIGLPVRDTRIEPAMEEIGDQVEEHNQAGEEEGDGHEAGGAVVNDGADQSGTE